MGTRLTLGNQTTMKSSAVRGLRQAIVETYPALAGTLDELIPKKETVLMIKCTQPERVTLYAVGETILFFQPKGDVLYPTLRLLHSYPSMMPCVRVDTGAIKFVMKGSNIMCPGLTSPGGDVSAELAEGAPVAVLAEGKVHALAVGKLAKSTAAIRAENADIGVTTLLFLGDAMWSQENISG